MIFGKNKSSFEFLIVGLGNPGLQYERTRHNAGFMAADVLAEHCECEFSKHKFDSVYGEGNVSGHRVLIAKPQTYMNLSGKAVVQISSFYKIPLEKIIVIFDDVSLDVGKIRLRRKGSAGGHNGMKDIIELMGSDEISRIKIGVGKKPRPDYDLKDWVLGRIPAELEDSFSSALENAASAVQTIICRGMDTAMNRYSK